MNLCSACMLMAVIVVTSPSPAPAATARSRPAMFPQNPSQSKAILVPGSEMPDEGPRMPVAVRGPETFVFDEAVRAYHAEDLVQAEQKFARILQEYPGSGARSTIRAFLAELVAKDRTDQRRRWAVEQYRLLIHDDPQSPNAARARWRIGDLYAEAGWFVEAKAAYEQAAQATDWDGARASLGLGQLFFRHAQWAHAERAFRRVRTITDDGRLLAPATFGLADSLAAQRRGREAAAVYEEGIRDWPHVFRGRPDSIIRLADIQDRLDPPRGRALYLLFRNLYPDHPDAPVMLIKVADSWRRESADETARRLYGLALSTHPRTLAEAYARMRLTELGYERPIREQASSLRWRLAQDFDLAPPLFVEPAEQAAVFRSVGAAYPAEPLASEALFHLGELLEATDQPLEAVQVYRELSDRRGLIKDDPWPEAGGRRLQLLLQPWMAAAIPSQDDFVILTLYYRHGRYAQDLYLGTDVLLGVADAHRRAGFAIEAIKLYQVLLHSATDEPVLQGALLGLAHVYVHQADWTAARRVFERFLLQYPVAPGKPDALKGLATTLTRLGEDRAVIRLCQQWLRLVGERPHADREAVLALLAGAEAKQGKVHAALEHYAAIDRGGVLSSPFVRVQYAEALRRAGRVADAVSQFQAVASTGVPLETQWSVIRMIQLTAEQQRYREAQALAQQWREATGDPFLDRVADVLATPVGPEASGG